MSRPHQSAEYEQMNEPPVDSVWGGIGSTVRVLSIERDYPGGPMVRVLSLRGRSGQLLKRTGPKHVGLIPLNHFYEVMRPITEPLR
jgi:hypothetical protein